MRRLSTPTAILALVAATLLLAACDDDGNGNGGSTDVERITVTAEVVQPAAPVTVEATEVGPITDGEASHGVRVTWNGDGPARIDDARFTHHVEEAGGHLITAGRGCGASWDEQSNEIMHPCQDDLQIIELSPGDTHEYPVVVHLEVGDLALAPGTYVIEEPIAWWSPPTDDPRDAPAEQFTIRLTYTVE
jgi:hypothetical protein